MICEDNFHQADEEISIKKPYNFALLSKDILSNIPHIKADGRYFSLFFNFEPKLSSFPASIEKLLNIFRDRLALFSLNIKCSNGLIQAKKEISQLLQKPLWRHR